MLLKSWHTWESYGLRLPSPGPPSTVQHSTHTVTLHLQPVPFRDTLLDLWSENSSPSMAFGGIFCRCLWNPSYCCHIGKMRETVDLQEQCDCRSKNSNLPHCLCCPWSAHQCRELKCRAVHSFTISCTGSSSQFLFYSHQLLLCPAGCYPAEAECIQFFFSLL